MNTKELVDSLFDGYEETAALADFKEELLGNLNAKIENLVKKGMETDAAFAQASAELGDISLLADELSLKKRMEAFEEAYMDIRKYMSSGRVAAYVIFGVLALFGITAGLIAFFSTRGLGLNQNLNMISMFGTMMPFLVSTIAGFTFLGITQETASMYPVSNKRAVWYTVAAALAGFGIFTMPLAYFSSILAADVIGQISPVVPIIAMMIPFVLPGVGILVFLGLTEKNRLKPWAKDLHKKTVEQEMAMWHNPAVASRFGMFSGAIWIFAIGLFVLLGFLIGFRYSWLVFIFATAFQLVVQGIMYKQSDSR